MTIIDEDFKEMFKEVIGCKLVGVAQIKDDRFVRDEFAMSFDCPSGKVEMLVVPEDYSGRPGYNLSTGKDLLKYLGKEPKVYLRNTMGRI